MSLITQKEIYVVYSIAERKLNERAMSELLRMLVECHYTKPDILRLALSYWEDACTDQAQRKGTFIVIKRYYIFCGNLSFMNQ